MRIVVGLGNPGKQYANTPHNAGYQVLDLLADELAFRWRRSLRFKARLSQGVWNGERLLLAKPSTYMNRSGEAVARLLRFHRSSPDELVVVLDDADLPLGRLRVRARGGSGGHRGLASVIEHAGGEGFARVRVGIGRDERGAKLIDQVLRPLDAGQRRELSAAAKRGAAAVRCLIEEGPEAAMNRFNGAPSQTGPAAGNAA